MRADGQTKTLRDRDISGNHAQKIDVAPWVPAAVTPGMYGQLVAASVVQLSVPAGATHVMLTVDGGDVRFTEDGSTPTSANGLILTDGSIAEFSIVGSTISFIRSNTTASATIYLNATFRRYV